MESCLALAGAMARQWFGVLMQPCGAEDAWVLEGLAAYLEDVFARAAMGQDWRKDVFAGPVRGMCMHSEGFGRSLDFLDLSTAQGQKAGKYVVVSQI
eukprot:1156949-Pelagomonas_calceolata.AAC.6